MAGGWGSRLRPLTCNLPKPMVPLLSRPVMEYSVKHLVNCGVKEAAITTAYLAPKIKTYFGDGSSYSIQLSYYHENKPLGTGGSIRNARDFTTDTFVVISGDALTDLDLTKAFEFHQSKGALATLVLHRQPIPLQYGVVITDEEGKIIRFLEKPAWNQVFSDTVNTGIYILEPEALDEFAQGEEFDFSKDLFPKLLKKGAPLYGYISDCYWCDIGDMRTYRQAQYDMLDNLTKLPLPGSQVAPGIWLDSGAQMGDCQIQGPLYVGSNSRVADGVKLESYNIIGANCSVAGRSSLKRTIIWDSSSLAQNVECRGATICSGVSVGENAHIYEGAVIGCGTTLGDRTMVKPETKVWPEKYIEADTQSKGTLMWGTKHKSSIFGSRGVDGRIEGNLTPQWVAHLGQGLAAIAPNLLVISRDQHPVSSILADALSAGARAGGSGVLTLETNAKPLARFACRGNHASGGAFIRTNEKGLSSIEILNKIGAPLNKAGFRKLENLLHTHDAPRQTADLIGSWKQGINLVLAYYAEALPLLHHHTLNFTVVLASKNDELLSLTQSFLESLGCQVRTCGDYSIPKMAEQVVSEEAAMGIILSTGGERYSLIDNRGNPVPEHCQHALVTRIAAEKGDKVVIPADKPDVPGISLNKVSRLGPDLGVVMSTLLEESLLQYILRYDGIRAAGLILDWLQESRADLAGLVSKIPPIHYKKMQINCPWQKKSRILREFAPHQMGSTQEGVRIESSKGWALILPDNDRPLLSVFAQGHREEFAPELAEDLRSRITSLLQQEDNPNK